MSDIDDLTRRVIEEVRQQEIIDSATVKDLVEKVYENTPVSLTAREVRLIVGKLRGHTTGDSQIRAAHRNLISEGKIEYAGTQAEINSASRQSSVPMYRGVK